jgi:uncharacterized protein with NRDE domain
VGKLFNLVDDGKANNSHLHAVLSVMCLIFISFQHHPEYPLIIAANRDEFYARRTAAAAFWEDQPGLLAGRDLEAGGTWMGVTKTGRISMVTNYRDLRNLKTSAPSRGHLVSRFLETAIAPGDYLAAVEERGSAYNGFNLIVGDASQLWYLSNYGSGVRKLKPGFYGLSNHLLDSPWPKVTRGKAMLAPVLAKPGIRPDDLMDVLLDEVLALDNELPDTGIGMERERALSSMFIKAGNYGSRSTTVVLVDKAGNLTFAERVYDTTTFQFVMNEFHFKIQPA